MPKGIYVRKRKGKIVGCIVCKKRFYCIPYRIKQRPKYCSSKCFGKSLKGKSPWNKGKKLPQYSGKNAGHWKGGRMKFLGYIFIFKPEHPFCSCRGYVFEHRLKMEKKIGRYLRPIERVHHINRIKDDNRLKNLKLFSTDRKHKKFHFPKGSLLGINKI